MPLETLPLFAVPEVEPPVLAAALDVGAAVAEVAEVAAPAGTVFAVDVLVAAAAELDAADVADVACVELPLRAVAVALAWLFVCAIWWTSRPKPATLAATTPDTANLMRIASVERELPELFMPTTMARCAGRFLEVVCRNPVRRSPALNRMARC